jgi:hypothetical protein
MQLLLWLEQTSPAEWIRESNSIFAYPTILFLHTLGLATVAGLSTFLNLRVLGFVRGLPFATLRPFITAIWAAFALTAASGTALLIANASTRVTPVFVVKMVFVALAVGVFYVMTRQVFRNPASDDAPLPQRAHVLAVLSVALWVAATTTGRLMAYLVDP